MEKNGLNDYWSRKLVYKLTKYYTKNLKKE